VSYELISVEFYFLYLHMLSALGAYVLANLNELK